MTQSSITGSRPRLGFRVWRGCQPEYLYELMITQLQLQGFSNVKRLAGDAAGVPPGNDQLFSIARRIPWMPGVNVARCHKAMQLLPVSSLHLAPYGDCECGFWCYDDHQRLLRGSVYSLSAAPADLRILGAIMYWGHCIEHTKGIRVQYAQILAICHPELSHLLHRYSVKYDVPFFQDVALFVNYAKEACASASKSLFDVSASSAREEIQ